MTDVHEQTKGKTLAGALCVLAVLVVCLAALSFVLYPKNNAPEDGMVDFEAFGLLGEPADTIDVVIMGDSVSFTSFSPLQMWNEQGFTSYVCGTKKQLLPYSDTMLRRVTENQHPSIVVIEVNMVFTETSYTEVLKRLGKNILPILEYHDRWRMLKLSDFYALPQATWTDPMKGFQANKNVIPAENREHMLPMDAIEPISDINAWFLQDMVDYCYSIGATPILVSTPTLTNWNMARHNAISAWAEQAGVAYVDFNLKETGLQINWETETRDGGDHLNYDGSVKFSHIFATWITQNYDLPDHRADATYASWHEAYERYCETVEALKPGDSAEHN